jgi:ubiquinone/menaquinone biosynthesis C-methylase UbiE
MGFYRERIFPRILESMASDEDMNALRQQAVAGAQGRVLEIGFGTGLNLEFYPRAVQAITAIDPNPGMERFARRRCEQLGIEVERHQGNAEALPFDTQSFDCVVSTLTLCSIPNVAGALNEVRRVLKPGGEFLFFEHGRHPEAKWNRWQDRLDTLWGKLFDGCHINRDIGALVAQAGMATTAVEHPRLPKLPALVGYCYLGRARAL